MRRLLIADPPQTYADAVAVLLKDDFVVKCCHEFSHILEDIQTFSPDYLVINLTTQVFDAPRVIRTAKVLGCNPAVIAVGDMPPFFLQTLSEKLGFVTSLTRPIIAQTIASRVAFLAEVAMEKMIPLPTLEEMIRFMAESLVLDNKLGGIDCLAVLIPMALKHPDLSLTNDYYVDTGKKLKISKGAVEKRIRDLIDHAWENRERTSWYNYFPPNSKGYTERPSNRDFIALMRDILKAQKGQYQDGAE